MKKSFLSVAILLLFSVSWGSAYALDDGYNGHEVDTVQTDALASLYDKSTAKFDSDSLDGAVGGLSINRPNNNGLLKSESYAAFTGYDDDTDQSILSIEQTDYGNWRNQS